MSLCGPTPTLDITLTQFDNGTIAFQFAAQGRQADSRDVARVLAAVLRLMNTTGPETPAPLVQPLFQESAV